MKRRSIVSALLALLCLFCLADAARAVIIFDQKTMRRTDGQATLGARLRFMVEDEGGYTRFLYVNVRYRILGNVPLEPSQSESFRVIGQVITGGTGYVHHVLVRIRPVSTVYAYPTKSKTIVVVGPMQGSADFSVQPVKARALRRPILFERLHRSEAR